MLSAYDLGARMVARHELAISAVMALIASDGLKTVRQQFVIGGMAAHYELNGKLKTSQGEVKISAHAITWAEDALSRKQRERDARQQAAYKAACQAWARLKIAPPKRSDAGKSRVVSPAVADRRLRQAVANLTAAVTKYAAATESADSWRFLGEEAAEAASAIPLPQAEADT